MSFKNKILILCFFEGFSLMAIEIISSKFLSPFYGSSILILSTVLFVTLGALSFGYFVGGIISKKKNNSKILKKIILLSIISISLIPFTYIFILPLTLNLSFEVGVFISTILLIFPTIFLFGTYSPILISIYNQNSAFSTSIIFFYSTIGGFFSSLLYGFILIPFYGLYVSTISVLVILFLSTLSFLKK